jgi:hypothetical protein
MALVAGQLALCSVIGWVTFGDLLHPAASAQRDAAVSTLPVPLPVPEVSGPSSSAVPSTVATPPAHTRTQVRTSASTKPPPTSRPVTVSKATVAAEPDGAVLLPAPGDDEAVQEPVKRNTVCSPEDALGRTRNGDWLRCLRGDDDELRWRRV